MVEETLYLTALWCDADYQLPDEDLQCTIQVLSSSHTSGIKGVEV